MPLKRKEVKGLPARRVFAAGEPHPFPYEMWFNHPLVSTRFGGCGRLLETPEALERFVNSDTPEIAKETLSGWIETKITQLITSSGVVLRCMGKSLSAALKMPSRK